MDKSRGTLIICFLLFLSFNLVAQDTLRIKGYVSQADNRGFIKDVEVAIKDFNSGKYIQTVFTNRFGEFEFKLEAAKDYKYLLSLLKEEYFEQIDTISSDSQNDSSGKVFLKYLMKRKPGYTFEISLTDIRISPDAPVDGITDALIEVYNNTEDRLVTSFENKMPEFTFNLNKGNHYTILIRKDGYLAKKLEAYLNVNGCIICFDGVSQMSSGVKADLYDNNTVGKYRANIELDKLFEGKKIQINNIYYALDKADITSKAREELDKLANILMLHKNLTVELGSHTDCRGSDDYNLKLSSRRAEAAVNYLVTQGNISKHRMKYKGYGEKELKNRCDDGVKCSEAEHSVNRRTEIKILDIGEADPNDFVSLEAIKNQEKFEERYRQMIEGKSEVVKVSGDQLPDEVLKEVEKNRVEQKKKNETKTKVIENSTQNYEQPIVPKTDKTVSVVKKSKKIEKKQPVKTVEKEKAIKKEKVVENKVVSKKVSDDKISSNKVNGNNEVYRVVILFTRYPLPKKHIIYQNIPNVEEYDASTDKGYVLYLVGKYKNRREAEAEMNKKWRKRFKKAYVAKFVNGKLLQD